MNGRQYDLELKKDSQTIKNDKNYSHFFINDLFAGICVIWAN